MADSPQHNNHDIDDEEREDEQSSNFDSGISDMYIDTLDLALTPANSAMSDFEVISEPPAPIPHPSTSSPDSTPLLYGINENNNVETSVKVEQDGEALSGGAADVNVAVDVVNVEETACGKEKAGEDQPEQLKLKLVISLPEPQEKCSAGGQDSCEPSKVEVIADVAIETYSKSPTPLLCFNPGEEEDCVASEDDEDCDASVDSNECGDEEDEQVTDAKTDFPLDTDSPLLPASPSVKFEQDPCQPSSMIKTQIVNDLLFGVDKEGNPVVKAFPPRMLVEPECLMQDRGGCGCTPLTVNTKTTVCLQKDLEARRQSEKLKVENLEAAKLLATLKERAAPKQLEDSLPRRKNPLLAGLLHRTLRRVRQRRLGLGAGEV